MITYFPQNFVPKTGSIPKTWSIPTTNKSLLNPGHHLCPCSSSLSNPSSVSLLFHHKLHCSLSSPSMALSIARPKHRSFTNPTLIHLFSTSSSSTNPPSNQLNPQNDTDSQSLPSQSPFASQFSDLKASLKQQRQSPQYQNQENKPNRPPLRKAFNASHSTSGSFEEIKKNLAEFRSKSSVPPPTESNNAGPVSYSGQPRQQIRISDLYKQQNLSQDTHGSSASTESTQFSGRLAFEKIKESLAQTKLYASGKNASTGKDATSFPGFRSNWNVKPTNETVPMTSSVTWGTQDSASLLSRKEDGNVNERLRTTEFVKMYSYVELGDKLRNLRPEVKDGEKGSFSLAELNERLRKLRQIEEKEAESTMGGVLLRDIRASLLVLGKTHEEKSRKSSSQPLNICTSLSSTPSYMTLPPKEPLVEKYFHPDNMSSAEKMKIELAKVREEFKMSESDCGSARVQVAQLTTKIKHLSSVLHKKDKHSRKGLQEMVQRRKKLLKYLRRTDWDSYCFVLSKLSLRDNPDFKH
ncbi:hypothetical protein JCGZ_06065 [Jatropha curcas]|uniref:Small ribosomal subunit protein uS15c n=1 Tax=Jatropha curcas TaxID=180498 RepID=A0A067KYS3_JATCU|nr:cell wall protein RBR3 [Jatropha curcas]KDP37009.1 hypothetical protein JCGZ_06065 [Jatropha curcas]